MKKRASWVIFVLLYVAFGYGVYLTLATSPSANGLLAWQNFAFVVLAGLIVVEGSR